MIFVVLGECSPGKVVAEANKCTGYMFHVIRACEAVHAKMAARDVPVRARARRSKVGIYAGSMQARCSRGRFRVS